MTTIRRAFANSLFLGLATGCGAGAPLLHPAHVLGTGDVRAAAGISAQGIAGDVSQSLKDTQNTDTTQGLPQDPGYTRGALALVALAPGIAPFVSARVGLGSQFEGGVTYTGRGARIDARRAFTFGSWALSVGAALDGTFAGGSSSTKLAGVDIGSLRGFGFDVPILFGWRSSGGIYQAWIGARGGYAHHFISAVTTEPKLTGPVPLDADQAHFGGLFGIATGFRHVHVALELEIDFQHIDGNLNGVKASVQGVSVTPATALWWDF